MHTDDELESISLLHNELFFFFFKSKMKILEGKTLICKVACCCCCFSLTFILYFAWKKFLVMKPWNNFTLFIFIIFMYDLFIRKQKLFYSSDQFLNALLIPEISPPLLWPCNFSKPAKIVPPGTKERDQLLKFFHQIWYICLVLCLPEHKKFPI